MISSRFRKVKFSVVIYGNGATLLLPRKPNKNGKGETAMIIVLKQDAIFARSSIRIALVLASLLMIVYLISYFTVMPSQARTARQLSQRESPWQAGHVSIKSPTAPEQPGLAVWIHGIEPVNLDSRARHLTL